MSSRLLAIAQKRWRTAPDDDYEEEIAALNRLLARAAWHDEVVVTKEGSRLIAAACGNRAKVAAFRQRQRNG